jgi:predicted enzyme related to lactoylglutathione lyase
VLTHNPMTAILPVRDLNRARDFYENKLGLQAEGMQADGKFLLRCGGGARIALFPKPDGTKAEHTAMSFRVEDIVSEIRELKHRGVQFHDYDLPGLMTFQHVCVLGSEKAAWFSDTEGNVLCLHEERKAARAS